jgi:hypothetical protein
MRHRSLGWLGLTLALASCATAAGSGAGGAAAENALAPALTALVVVRSSGPLEPGDTLQVDLAGVSDDGRVAYRGRGGRSGTVPLDVLGAAAGSMVVRADKVNVRRCRSRGCSVIGYVARGQIVQVHDFVAGWYRLRGEDDVKGYIRAEYLELPVAYRRVLLDEIRRRTAAYYARALEGVTVDGYGAVFSGHRVDVKDEGMLSIEFYTPFRDGPPSKSACEAMRGIADFVQRVMAAIPGELFSAYSVGIYYRNSPGSPVSDEAMVAGLTGDGDAFCPSPD